MASLEVVGAVSPVVALPDQRASLAWRGRKHEVVPSLQGSQRPMGLFTYDVTLEQVSMPDVDSMPPTPDVRSSWPENDINDSRRPSIAEQKPLQQVGKRFAIIAYAYLFHCLRVGDWTGWGKHNMSETAASCLSLCILAQGHAMLLFLKRCNPLCPLHMQCCMCPGQTASLQR